MANFLFWYYLQIQKESNHLHLLYIVQLKSSALEFKFFISALSSVNCHECKSGPTDLRHYDQDNTPAAPTHTSPAPRQSPTSPAQPPATIPTTHRRHTHRGIHTGDRHYKTLTYAAAVSSPGAGTATHIADTITLAADTATGDSTAPYGAETTHWHQMHWCLQSTNIPPAPAQPLPVTCTHSPGAAQLPAQPPATSATYAANTCTDRNAPRLIASYPRCNRPLYYIVIPPGHCLVQFTIHRHSLIM
jgi:hypothetical protein